MFQESPVVGGELDGPAGQLDGPAIGPRRAPGRVARSQARSFRRAESAGGRPRASSEDPASSSRGGLGLGRPALVEERADPVGEGQGDAQA